MSNKNVWWLCPKGHEWQTRIENRTLGDGCPYCAGHQPTLEYNLAVIYPDLVRERSPRNALPPTAFLPVSSQKVWWYCAAGHEWRALIGNRVHGAGCRACFLSQTRSAPEVALVNSLAAWLNQDGSIIQAPVGGVYWPRGAPVTPDFLIDHHPIKFAVEYDGRWFHQTRKAERKDRAKTKLLQQAGFLTIRIRENPLPVLDSALDLVLKPALIYQDRAQGFLYLVKAARDHVDRVCRDVYGDVTWENFLLARCPVQATLASLNGYL